jgi:hypothetical protein
LAAQAAKAERQWKAGHLAAFHKTVSKLFRDKPARTGAQGLLSKDGRSVYRSTQQQLERFTEYFHEVFSGECVTPEQQRQFYSFLCSLVKLCYCVSQQSVLQAGVMWNPVDAVCAAVQAMHLEDVQEGQEYDCNPKLDALPSVFIIGRCCLLWADILSARREDGELALQEREQCVLKDFLQNILNAAGCTAEVCLHFRSAELSAAGYPDPNTWLQQLRAAAAAAVAAHQAEGDAVDGQCVALVQELRALGQASCLFAVPLFCNNPRCMRCCMGRRRSALCRGVPVCAVAAGLRGTAGGSVCGSTGSSTSRCARHWQLQPQGRGRLMVAQPPRLMRCKIRYLFLHAACWCVIFVSVGWWCGLVLC